MKINKLFAASLFVGSMALMAFTNSTQSTTSATIKAGGDEVKTGLNIGDKAPEIKLNDPNGKEIALSDLKGKMVLIDFWAGWCPPCRRENPNVVATYQKFKDAKFENAKGFTVYSVSLDSDKNIWQNAIMKDKLSWPNHVSDLKKWNTAPRKDYKFNGIPFALLIDGDGIIVGKGEAVRGEALPALLKNLEKK